jgi:ectoine hydroxylase-related dioxygenase (phytanoyl-CoA dioxygenase family)
MPGVLTGNQLERMRASLEQLTVSQYKSSNNVANIDNFMVHNPFVHDPVFFQVLENQSVVDMMDELLGETSIVYAFTTSSMPPNGTNYSNRIHVDCPRVIPNYISNIGMIIALDDFTVENGATYFMPESFYLQDQPPEEVFLSSAKRVLPQRGDMVVFNARTWHLGGQNTTDTFRHAITINACRSFMRQRFDYPRMLGWDKADHISPTLRRVLGYNVRVPASLEEYYLPADRRLYHPNQG